MFSEHGTDFNKYLLIRSHMTSLFYPPSSRNTLHPIRLMWPHIWDPQGVQEASTCLRAQVIRTCAFLFVCFSGTRGSEF